ncbi:MAG: transposase [Myxococcales bacterium]|nr:transposase [Myxococcales bacterium]
MGRDQFVFDEATGRILRCPAGHAPVRHGQRRSDASGESTGHAFFDGATCRDCPLRQRCVARPPSSGHRGDFHVEVLPKLRARDQRLGGWCFLMKFLSWPPLIPAPYSRYDSGFFRTIRLKFGWPKIPLKNTTHLAEQKTSQWKSDYAICCGIEATNSELKRAHGLGKLRVRRLPRVRLAVSLKLTACNAKRWLRATGNGRKPDLPKPPSRANAAG